MDYVPLTECVHVRAIVLFLHTRRRSTNSASFSPAYLHCLASLSIRLTNTRIFAHVCRRHIAQPTISLVMCVCTAFWRCSARLPLRHVFAHATGCAIAQPPTTPRELAQSSDNVCIALRHLIDVLYHHFVITPCGCAVVSQIDVLYRPFTML